MQGRIVTRTNYDGARRHKLAQQGTPLRLRNITADTEGTQLLMLILRDTLGYFPSQHVQQVSAAKSHTADLLKTVNRAQQLTRIFSRIKHLGGHQAVVAIAARLAALAKIIQQMDAPAIGRLCQGQ